MERLTLTLPALYADHHVASVRAALQRLDGVSEIRTSPARHEVSLRYDNALQTPQAIEATLASAGYTTGDPERSFPSAGPAQPRPTATVEGSMAFTHEAPAWEGRPLWPCPGFDRPPQPDE